MIASRQLSLATVPVSEAVCRVTSDAFPCDLRIAGVTYRGAAVHGSGGLIRGTSYRGQTPRERIEGDLSGRLRRGEKALIHTVHTATETESFQCDAGDVEVLAVRVPDAERDQ